MTIVKPITQMYIGSFKHSEYRIDIVKGVLELRFMCNIRGLGSFLSIIDTNNNKKDSEG